MPIALLPSFLFYCFTNGITPGPANLCSLSASMHYGKRVALRQWRGLFVGFWIDAMFAVAICYFLGEAFGDKVKWLAWIGAAYITWLAIHLLRSSLSEEPVSDDGSRCNFLSGLLVQLTNVKVILFCLTALSSYVLPYDAGFWPLFLVGCCLPLTGPLCNLVWLFAGAALRSFFLKHQKPLNIAMAIALIACAISLVWH